MRKKVVVIFLFLFVSISFSFGDKIGDKINDVLYTDIITEINGQEVESFNINGSTAIYVSEVEILGYDVTWNGDSRTVTIENNLKMFPKYEKKV